MSRTKSNREWVVVLKEEDCPLELYRGLMSEEQGEAWTDFQQEDGPARFYTRAHAHREAVRVEAKYGADGVAIFAARLDTMRPPEAYRDMDKVDLDEVES